MGSLTSHPALLVNRAILVPSSMDKTVAVELVHGFQRTKIAATHPRGENNVVAVAVPQLPSTELRKVNAESFACAAAENVSANSCAKAGATCQACLWQ